MAGQIGAEAFEVAFDPSLQGMRGRVVGLDGECPDEMLSRCAVTVAAQIDREASWSVFEDAQIVQATAPWCDSMLRHHGGLH